MVEIDARHRLAPHAASFGAATATAVCVEDHQVARIDEHLDRLVGLEDRGCRGASITQRDVGEIEMDEAFRAGDLGRP